MNTKLEEEIHFQFSSFRSRPIGIIFVNFGALSATTNNRREPILFPEEDVGNDGGEWVEAGVKAQFEYIGGFFISDFSLILVIDKLIDFVPHKVIVTVFGGLEVRGKFTKMKKNPTATQMRESTAKT